MSRLPYGARALAAMFIVSGATHLVRPQVFEPIVPDSLPYRRELVYASGIAEIACAAGMLLPRTRRVAGRASASLLVAVFPANVQMVVDAHRALARKGSTPARRAVQVGTLARLPLQVPMIRWALRAGDAKRM